MKTSLILCASVLFLSSQSYAQQMFFEVNTLADDEYSYAWDDPNTTVDESMDGICEDELHRCSLGAAVGESSNMNIPVSISFSVNGTINLLNTVYLLDGSSINGGKNIELAYQFGCMAVENNTTVEGLRFKGAVFGAGLTVTGENNNIGVAADTNGNEFIGCQIGLLITGDSNIVYGNYIGITRNNIVQPNQSGVMLIGSANEIGRTGFMTHNTICGNSLAGMIVGGSDGDGSFNRITYNLIGTNINGDGGIGNTQGIIIQGGSNNFIEFNTISGNQLHGVFIGGVPPKTNSPSNMIAHNNIGLEPLKKWAVPNGNGIVITNGNWVTHVDNNIISGNNQVGILIKGINDTVHSRYILVTGNKIGLNDNLASFPNNTGIAVEGNVSDIWIGSAVDQDYDANIIANNLNGGIAVKTGLGGYAPNNVCMRKNIIKENLITNLFVEPAANSGIQPPNGLSFSGTTLAGIHQLANAVIDIYDANTAAGPPSAHKWLGSTTTGSNGVFSFDITDPLVEAVSVTASTSSMGTSSFSYYEIVTGVEDEYGLPTVFSLNQNYPNPFNPVTTIKYDIPSRSLVNVTIYDLLGRAVKVLISNEVKQPGTYEARFDASGLASGTYFYRLTAGEYISTKKMIVVK